MEFSRTQAGQSPFATLITTSLTLGKHPYKMLAMSAYRGIALLPLPFRGHLPGPTEDKLTVNLLIPCSFSLQQPACCQATSEVLTRPQASACLQLALGSMALFVHFTSLFSYTDFFHNTEAELKASESQQCTLPTHLSFLEQRSRPCFCCFSWPAAEQTLMLFAKLQQQSPGCWRYILEA